MPPPFDLSWGRPRPGENGIATTIAQRAHDDLLDAIYRAAQASDAWYDVMALMRQSFPSSAQTFYFLEREERALRAVCLDGIERKWIGSFEPLFFAPDNPWMRVSESLHRPGVVRTNERLDAFLHTDGALYRSAYYNDWMRPQGFRFTLGNTLLADGGTVANITLMRPADMPTFSAGEVRRFEQLSRHMTRSLQLGIRMERAAVGAGAAAWQQLPQAAVLVDAGLRVRAANAAMETLLRRCTVLALRDGRLLALHGAAHAQLAARVDALWHPHRARADEGLLWLPQDSEGHGHFAEVFPFDHHPSPYLPAERLAMLLVREPLDPLRSAKVLLPGRFGCTATETRLALLLADGHDLGRAAGEIGLTYETARIYLKRLFAKLDVHTQGQLVSRVLRLGAGGPAPG